MVDTLERPDGFTNFAERIKFHDSLQIMEVDFSHLTFATRQQVHQFYDEVDHLVQDTADRWYFLVNYQGCVIAPDAWNDFAARGKQANINYSRGTVRIGATDQTRQSIRERARTE